VNSVHKERMQAVIEAQIAKEYGGLMFGDVD
jgi:hypothetical protein